MKKMYRYLLMAVLAICLSIPAFAAEAASIALLPLINNNQGDEIANQVYFKSAINAINAQKGFMLVENDKLTAAIDAAKIAGKVPSKAALEKIAKDGNVDIVIAMELDKLDDITLYSSEGNMMQLVLDGKAVAYYKITGEFYQHRIYDDKQVPEALTTRWDWTHEEWGRNVRAEINRILKVKKIMVDAPRMSKL
ncbi:hypothetical protein [Phascolarctobacterium sp.]|uniref:hypothetical protein n=1 Tax=Phascolarctobacterium sp. TaxID=2049039 RepID=UPI002A80D266|nr:hypothetical protein [Phascolarctobacterium sp.]MDY5045904.1 hypothetical protein [Phascolarctobacterium sp.]